MICDSPELSAADDALGEVFLQAREKTGNSAAFKKLARENLKKRGRCKTEKCLKKWYRESMDLYGMIAGEQVNSAGAEQKTLEKPAAKAEPEASPKNVQKKGKAVRGKNGAFVSGLKNYVSYKIKDDSGNNGIAMQYAGEGRNLTVSLFFNRTGMDALLKDPKGRKSHIDLDFSALYEKTSGEDNGTGEYALGQHDFDGDGTDEIVIAGRTFTEDSGAVSFCVYRVSDGKTWNFGASNILGEGEAKIEGNTVLSERHLHGLVHIWQFRDDDFTGEELPMGGDGFAGDLQSGKK